MKKSISSLLLLSSISVFAQADEIKSVSGENSDKVRLVISGDVSMMSAQSMHRTSSLTRQADGFSIMTVDKNEAEAMIELLKQQPGVRAVEPDYPTSSPPMPKPDASASSHQGAGSAALIGGSDALSGDSPNDPEYGTQYAWRAPTELYEGQHDILGAYKASTQNEKVRVGVTDSGFYDREDIAYAGGYNFTTLNGGTVSPLFFEDEYNPSCDSPHGGAVAHIIAAKTDNGVGVAGIVDADIYGVRVMDCGSGLLSEMAKGFRYLARDTSLSGVTPIEEPVDIINVSMGGQVEYCPSYVQDAINFAYNRGIAIFVSAGNDGLDVSGQTPANCENVITVASVDRQGFQSGFSNHGAKIDVSALGEAVKSEGTTGYSFWYGTSFSGPNAAGIAALAKQTNPGMSVDELYSYVKSTTRSYGAGKTQNALGTGIVDAIQLMTTVNADLTANLPQLNPALDASERCQKAALSNVPFIDENGNAVDACAIFELDTSFVETPGAGFPNRSLYRIPQGGSYAVSGAELVKASTEESFVAYHLDPQTYDYGYAACDAENTVCESDTLIPLNDDSINPSRYCIKP